jgi:hypothetical protein
MREGVSAGADLEKGAHEHHQHFVTTMYASADGMTFLMG